MKISIQTVILLERPGFPNQYLSLAEARQMAGGLTQLSKVIQQSQEAAAEQAKADEDKPKSSGVKRKPQRKAGQKANGSDTANP